MFEQKSEDEVDITPLSVMDKIRRSKGPFQASRCIAPPVDYTLESEPALKMLNNYIINIVSSTKVESNLSKSEAIGIKSLKKRDNISITISDKGGDFMVTSNNFQDYITQHHINSNPDVYKFVPPTRRYCGIIKEIANPTENTFRSQIKNKVQLLEEVCNDKLRELTNDKIQDWRFHKTFSTHHSSLPTMYVMLKTHKLSPDTNISEVPWDSFKVRPIVSCCGSPSEKVGWLINYMLTPLMDAIPSHLHDIHSHLEYLRNIPSDELKGNKFFSADISSLYTNLSIEGSIKNILELADEYKDKLNLLGMNLRDLEELLELGLGNAFFTYNNRMYHQKRGLFMGYLPCPKIAVIQVYSFERRSIYSNTDCITDITKATYRRYMDDAERVALNEEQALIMLNAIAEQDPDRRIAWELDFQRDTKFVPFLDSIRGTTVNLRKRV